MRNSNVEIDRVVQEISGNEFLAGVEATTIAGHLMKWMESAALIQGQAFQDWVQDWQ